MKYICDFHIHSKYSRATSKKTDLENLEKWAKIKGISVLGTGDFTHPEWLVELKEGLRPAEKGLFRRKGIKEGIRFMLTAEVSCIYSKNDKIRKIHILIFAPSFEVVDEINKKLSLIGNLRSDGRPIIGMDAKDLAKIVFETSSDCVLVPAHIWTPWFSLFGSRSGFDTVEECFEEFTPKIFAMETGLSSDPAMNWRISALDKYTMISNSDAHSPQKVGREANVFKGEELNYSNLMSAIKEAGKTKQSSPLKLVSTIEFFPEEGKYHFDGHRLCQVRLSPEERKKYGGICPNCGKPLTIGVLSRVDDLADRKEGEKPINSIPFKKLVPLDELISKAFGLASTASKRVDAEYQKLIEHFKSEFDILLNVPIEEISKISLDVSKAIKKAREENLTVIPGYDGEYGKVQIKDKIKERKQIIQETLF